MATDSDTERDLTVMAIVAVVSLMCWLLGLLWLMN
jgi:hypothetical protein